MHAAFRTSTALAICLAGWAAIGRLVDLITPAECANVFAAAGYDAT